MPSANVKRWNELLKKFTPFKYKFKVIFLACYACLLQAGVMLVFIRQEELLTGVKK